MMRDPGQYLRDLGKDRGEIRHLRVGVGEQQVNAGSRAFSSRPRESARYDAIPNSLLSSIDLQTFAPTSLSR